MNAIAAVGLSAILILALKRYAKDIGENYSRWIWVAAFAVFAIGFTLVK